ncbi:RNB domain-containing ribonuclease [Microbacterium dextranolyticum]|uniref:RNB domain-containing ribonuclease n=1 Tax=Microbacterium dextranolyticum TaxID=36806 RepID=UPI001D37FE57|nr:RNB domain-containing ribonuclease [Microbacterium dextranolyticum]MBM7463614.1 exoribonuclease R [Microbacterium dextranolyticum]
MTTRRARIMSTTTRGELAASLAALRRSLDLPAAYPSAALAEAERAADTVPTDPTAAVLADLRSIPFLTIDPEGSTDLDQALHLERTASGGILHYAIADVPAFVTPGGALDVETRRRGQTIYAPDGRIPLHPEVISEHAASLLPGVDRRAYVWRFVLDDGARPVETTLTRAVVRSVRQWSYVEAQAAIDDATAPESLRSLVWFGSERAARERERGGASLNIPEARIVVDGDGYRLELEAEVPLEDANAQVSLLTGMAAADIMLRGRIGILRTMPPAAPDDIARFRAQTVALGLPWRTDVPYGEYLQSLDRSPAARAVREYAGGLFRGAGYASFDGEPPAQTDQAAIAAPYAHTTAPLRRLVDRWSLVVCEALANDREVPEWARASLAELPALMARSSAVTSRWDAGALDRVEAAVLSGREGEVFEGVVLAVRGDGIRVQLLSPPVEAKVPGITAAPGDSVRLRLVAASIGDGTLRFAAA